MAASGRPLKLTGEVHDKVRATLAAGVPITWAARYVNVHRDTLYDWRDRGLAYAAHLEKGGKVKRGEEVFLRFSDMLEAAQAEAVVGAVVRLREAMNGRGVRVVDGHEVTFEADPEPRWAAWYLQHCHPREFGGLSRMELSGPDGGPVQHETSEAVVDRLLGELDRMGERLARANTAKRTPAPTPGE